MDVIPLTSGFPINTLYMILHSPLHATCSAHLIILDFITRTILGEQYQSWSSLLCTFLHSPVNSSLLDPNIFLSTLFSNTLSLHSSLSVRDQVLHPYKTKGKIIVLYISIFYTTWTQNKSCSWYDTEYLLQSILKNSQYTFDARGNVCNTARVNYKKLLHIYLKNFTDYHNFKLSCSWYYSF